MMYIQLMDNSKKTNEKLISLAKLARKNAYAPYSKFKVGSALLTKSGKIYTGCNVENATYGATICAERTAIVKAISEGEKHFKKIAIVCNTKEPCSPCGICRQMLYEFSPNMEVIMCNTKGKTEKTTLKTLLPCAFEKKQ